MSGRSTLTGLQDRDRVLHEEFIDYVMYRLQEELARKQDELES